MSQGRRPSSRFTLVFGLALAGAAALLHSSCGTGSEFNVFSPLTKASALKSDTKAKLEEARVDLDKRDYAGALAILGPVVDDPGQDSDDARVLFAGATLGVGGLDVWGLISDLLTTQRSGGLDQVLNSLSDSLLGQGAVRQAKVTAMIDAIDALEAAPTPGDPRVADTACIVAAFLAVPTVADATAAAQAMQAALVAIGQSASCPSTKPLDAALGQLTATAATFNYILKAASACTFLNLAKSAAQMNAVEQSLSLLMKTADKGCASIPAALPGGGCLGQVVASSAASAVAGDGKLAACELVLHCADPTRCFRAN